MKKWSFSSTFQVPKNSRTTQRIQEIQAVVPTIRYGIRHFCLQNLREMGSKTSYLPQIGKVWIYFSHLSCRIFGLRDIDTIQFLRKNGPWSFYLGDMIQPTTLSPFPPHPTKLSSLSIGQQFQAKKNKQEINHVFIIIFITQLNFNYLSL